MSNSADYADSPHELKYTSAIRRLSQLADEYHWDLNDLLDWFKDPMDMEDIARWTLPQVRQSVEFYINHHKYLRGKIDL